MFGLAAHRLFECEPEPCEIFLECRAIAGQGALRIDIFDAEQQATMQSPGEFGIQQSRVGMTAVQVSVRARCKTKNSTIFVRRGFRFKLIGCNHGMINTWKMVRTGFSAMMLESEEDFHHGIETLISRDPEMAALLAVAATVRLCCMIATPR